MHVIPHNVLYRHRTTGILPPPTGTREWELSILESSPTNDDTAQQTNESMIEPSTPLAQARNVSTKSTSKPPLTSLYDETMKETVLFNLEGLTPLFARHLRDVRVDVPPRASMIERIQFKHGPSLSHPKR